jgi:hypothetical protein
MEMLLFFLPLLLLGHTDSLALMAGGLGVLTPHTQAPEYHDHLLGKYKTMLATANGGPADKDH